MTLQARRDVESKTDHSRISVEYEGGDRFRMSVRGHSLLTDQPIDSGGKDHGPTPTELFVGSLVSCMGFFAQRFLRRNHIDASGLEMSATYETSAERPFRVNAIKVEIVVPAAMPDRLMKPLRRVIDACTVHNTLRQEPHVSLSIERPMVERAAS